MNDDFCWEEVVQEGEVPDFGLDVTGIDTTDDAVQIKPIKMKFNGFEMSDFSVFILF